jgi:hypothetical protein
MAHAGADAKPVAFDHKPPQRLDPIDVNEVRGPRQPERHDGNEALPAGQDTAVMRRDFRQQCHRLIDGPWRVVLEGRRLHLRSVSRGAAADRLAIARIFRPVKVDTALLERA